MRSTTTSSRGPTEITGGKRWKWPSRCAKSHRRGHAPVYLPLENRNLKIIPKPGRWGNKKTVYGKDWYAEQIGSGTVRR